jgi:hypothetical protein
MSEWRWFSDFARDAQAQGDTDRARLMALHHQAYHLRETEPDQTLALFAEGRRLAQALHEPWWVLLYDHWLVHGRIHWKDDDYQQLLEPAVRNLLETRKPQYAHFPFRFRIHNDLITLYLGIDPLVGHLSCT